MVFIVFFILLYTLFCFYLLLYIYLKQHAISNKGEVEEHLGIFSLLKIMRCK